MPRGTWTDADLSPLGPVSVEAWLGAPALSFPHRPHDVLDAVDAAVERWPRAVFGIDAATGEETTYRDLAARVAGTAQRLRGNGIQAGDGVAIAAGNSTSHAVALLATAAVGAVAVGLSRRLAPPQWAFMLRHSSVRLALHDETHATALAAAAGQAGLPGAALHDLDRATATTAPWSAPQLDEAATYQVVYTSGTTGRPKASQVVHRCSVHSGMAYQRELQLRHGERTAVLFSLGYISAMHAHVLPAVLTGGTCVWVEATHPRPWLEALRRYDVAWAYAVPSFWLLALRDRAIRHLPALRLAGAGGSAYPAALRAGLADALPHARQLDVYGLSETHSPATVDGRPLPCLEVDVRRDDASAAPHGEAGEVVLRGSLVTTGYAGDPDATAAAIDGDGWFRTGDVGRLDDQGRLQLLDRTKDMVNRAGTKVFSAEVERVLCEHPAVEESAVVAAPDRLAGETVVAFVVPAAGHDDAPALPELRRWVRERLSDAASPAAVHVVEALPRGGTGKTDKAALRERLAAAAPARIAP